MLTRGELDSLTVVCGITVVVHILTAAWAAWWQDRETARVRADLVALSAWCWQAAEALGWTGDDDPGGGGDDPPPDGPDPDDGPATVIAHPVDTEARKLALLTLIPRYTHIGQHRE